MSSETKSAVALWRERTARTEVEDAERVDAAPVAIVDVRLPLSAVFALYVQFAIIQIGVAAVVLIALFALGVL